MKVLVACEFSGIVRDAFLAEGHDAFSCDFLPTESTFAHPLRHFQMDVLELLNCDLGWDLMIAHPPCTYLTNAGVRHLDGDVVSRAGGKAKISGVERFQEMWKAAVFFNELKGADITRICIENPVPHNHAKERIGKYDQIIQPWQFGHEEQKAICFWLKNLPPLVSTEIRSGRSQRAHQMAPSENRAKERSRFFWGVAKAMATQWGSLGKDV